MRSLLRPWSAASPPIPHPTCTSCDCLTDLKDVTIFTFYYLLRVSIADVLFSRAFRKLTTYPLSLLRKFTRVKAAGQGSVGQEGCHTVQPQPPSTKLDKSTVCTLSAAVSLSQAFSPFCKLGATVPFMSLPTQSQRL